MLYTPMTKKAMKLCFAAHRDQPDKSGMPCAFHPFHVAGQMADEDSTVVALLHDVVEDTPYTLEDLRANLFKLDDEGNPTKEPYDRAGYMDVAPEDKGENVRREICLTPVLGRPALVVGALRADAHLLRYFRTTPTACFWSRPRKK